jgi:hypothetical protein
MFALAWIFTILYVCSSGSLSASADKSCQNSATPQELIETSMDTTERSLFDQLCDLMGVENTTLTNDEKKGLSRQQQAFEQCIKDSLQTKRSLDFYLKIAAISSIFLTAVSTCLVLRDIKSRRNNR